MDANNRHVARSVDRPAAGRVLRLSFALLGGAFAWGTHFLVNYILVSIQCVTGWFGSSVLGASVLMWLILLATLISIGVTIAAFVTARRVEREATADDAPADGYRMYMARGGVWLNSLFILLISLETLPIFFLRPCG